MSDRANVTGDAGGNRGTRWRIAAIATIAGAVVLGVAGLAGRSAGQESKRPRGKVAEALIGMRWEPDAPVADRERFLATLVVRRGPRRSSGPRSQAHPEIARELDALGQPDVLRWMHDAVAAEALDGTDLLQVSCAAPTPTLAIALARAVTDAIIIRSGNERSEYLDSRIKQLEDARREAEIWLSQRRKILANSLTTPSRDGSAPATSPAAAVEGLQEVRRELRRVRLEKKAAEIRLARQKANEPGNASLGKTMEEAVAVLAGQEDLLRRDESEAIEAIGRAEADRFGARGPKTRSPGARRESMRSRTSSSASNSS